MHNRDKDRIKPSGTRRVERQNLQERPSIESYSSPKTRHTDENAGIVFSAFVFVLGFSSTAAVGYLAADGFNIWVLTAATVAAVLAVFTVRIAPQWEKAVILRLGKYSRTAGPGLYFTVPFIEHIALHADRRVMLTGFGAEETLTADMVPVNVDAVIFWYVWDAEKACMEVEDYYDSVSLAAQTALRDAIGRKAITDVAMHRVQLDAELRTSIDEKTTEWGVSILFVEIRDVVIPKDLQGAMAVEAKAEREKDARIILAEVEKDIASMLLDATRIYREDELSFKLRSLHLLSEGVKESSGTIVVPSTYAEGFTRVEVSDTTTN
jgi:regulator of protease activity HflC (stomatin/prohibitin superfamily)